MKKTYRNVHEYIRQSTSLDPSGSINVEWSHQEKKKKKTNINKKFHAEGECPYGFDEIYGNERKSKNNSGSLDKNKDVDIEPWMCSKRADVREVNGGTPYNNEVIERIVQIKQSKSKELNSDGSSTITNSAYCTAESSEDSIYNTANSSLLNVDESDILQQSFGKKTLKSGLGRKNKSNIKSGKVPLVTCKENQNYCTGQSKTKRDVKNKTTVGNYQDDEFITHRPDITMENLKLVDDSSPETLRAQRVARFIQHKDDEDFYHHALFDEGVSKSDRKGLLRQGIEITHTPRTYYMSLSDDDFGFVTNDSKN